MKKNFRHKRLVRQLQEISEKKQAKLDRMVTRIILRKLQDPEEEGLNASDRKVVHDLIEKYG